MSSNISLRDPKMALLASFDRSLSLLCYSPTLLDMSLAQSIFLFRTRSHSFSLYTMARRHVYAEIDTKHYAFLYLILKNNFPGWSHARYEELKEANTKTEVELDLFFDEPPIKDSRDQVHHILISKFLLMIKFLDTVLPSFQS
jgi:hypothetical protein